MSAFISDIRPMSMVQIGRRFSVTAMLISAIGLGACSREEAPKEPVVAPMPEQAAFPVARVANGAKLFQKHCAECHGPEAQGHPDWKNPQVVVAPPLDGGGPVTKRTQAQMALIIQRGASRKGVATMPGWSGRLSVQDVDDIILWYQALWPSEVYSQWQKANAGQQQPRG
jgi:mono/diheme cytochrome c family protein